MKKIILLSIPFFLLLSACNNLTEENSNDTETKSETAKSNDVTDQVNNEFFGLWTNTEGQLYEAFMGKDSSKPVYNDWKCPVQYGFAPNSSKEEIKSIANLFGEFSEAEINDGLLNNIDNDLKITINNEDTLIEDPNILQGETNWEITEDNQLLMTNPETSGDKESYCLYEKTTEFQ